ncbi:MAG: putative K(+)-stimulated pyrophosphate-energized sodium pump [Candidatus Dependentiae bacterium ADurb.Bin331]|nr:MAG: putative K(+)-stimulated pyrophosphate-energized sodium pump [Candidatus Dependentiae bacterium ADurb.Bin331]
MEYLGYYAIIAGAGLLGIGVMLYLFNKITSIPVDNEKATSIAQAIRDGAMTFLVEEYKIIAVVALLVAVVLGYFMSPLAAGAFIFGALLSLSTGFIGMRAATLANVRTTMAAKNSGESAAFMIAFFGGGVMGFAVASFGLLGLGAIFYFYIGNTVLLLQLLTSFALGASLVAFFARVGGGIYTKSADVGADLVGKVEAGIPEDDPRNPAVIADNVGDNVGDTAGMGADIYESYVGATVSAIILATTTPTYNNFAYLIFPLLVISFGLIGSVVGLVVNSFLPLHPAAKLRNANLVASAVLVLLVGLYLHFAQMDMYLLGSIIIGCLCGMIIGSITEYYTGGEPIRKLADISRSGAATNLIYGLSVGMESVVAPVVILVLAVLLSFFFGGGVYGVSLAALAMLATVGISMTVDAYGPIADNAGGIAEMSGFGPEVRTITDKLDALGNTTAAMGKGFAIGSALLTALALFSAYAKEANLNDVLNVIDPFVLAGMFIGGALPFLISALTMRSVGKAALQMVIEVRRQFKEIPGLMEGRAQPDYKRCVAISTKASLREMLWPGLITLTLPVIINYLMGKAAVGGLLVGATVVGIMLALMMSNGGGAWDNAKKYIEAGNVGGKGSDAHKAAVIGDTVGDPFKDTSGPSLNILIKLMSIVSLLLVSR